MVFVASMHGGERSLTNGWNDRDSQILVLVRALASMISGPNSLRTLRLDPITISHVLKCILA